MSFDPEIDQIIDKLQQKECPDSIIELLRKWNGTDTFTDYPANDAARKQFKTAWPCKS
ncbi:MAG: hypothetical protein PHY28_04350 [Dehalococcoidales bacterium]|nr:hypothetical protein [Dehalococcoidales bacterium]